MATMWLGRDEQLILIPQCELAWENIILKFAEFLCCREVQAHGKHPLSSQIDQRSTFILWIANVGCLRFQNLAKLYSAHRF